MKVLIACEESQVVCHAFREKGHEAFSCDIVDPSGGNYLWHIKADVLSIINGCCTFKTMDGKFHVLNEPWDLIIAHPPCTYLTVSGNRWFDIKRYGDKAVQRMKNREEAILFFMRFVNSNAKRLAIENPIGVMSTSYRKPDQIINPYLFGDPFEKKTCLWLRGLPLLQPTNQVIPPERVYFDSGKSMAKWFADSYSVPKEERSRLRSRTFPGFALAMADQWGKDL